RSLASREPASLAAERPRLRPPRATTSRSPALLRGPAHARPFRPRGTRRGRQAPALVRPPGRLSALLTPSAPFATVHTTSPADLQAAQGGPVHSLTRQPQPGWGSGRKAG